ncbi:MAG: hypothetical protein M1837_003559 [Sclerophora amabilis]|nr:MAG: hypothetical protein M1837_003559 [Sclerophora amabilis]
MSSFGITGAQGGRGSNGSVPFRLEIRQLQRNPDQWNLYLLGLDRLQSVDQRELLSHYQMAGIHGRPFRPWDDVQATAGEESSGYCNHSSVLFPTWHRPYLALYEVTSPSPTISLWWTLIDNVQQALYSIVQEIAGEFRGADRNRYAAAAANFRMPYWDWAAAPSDGRGVLPDSVGGSQTVQVRTPTGTTTIRNPLFSYTFRPLNTQELPNAPFRAWPSTLRYPTNNTANAVSRNNLVGQQLDNNRLTLRNRLYNLFTSYPNYTNFSNKGWIPNDGGNYDSLESLHDQIHGLVGSGGHMGSVDYAAFDPIFWLHHTMVDRIFAIWQALYPRSYVQPEESQFGTFTTSPGETEDVNTALTPFHTDAQGNFWTSATSRSPKSFGYTYPELVDWDTTPQRFQANVRAAVNNLYGASVPSSPRDRPRFRGATPAAAQNVASAAPAISVGGFDGTDDQSQVRIVETAQEEPVHNALGKVVRDGKYREYIANIRVKKYALEGSFFVHIFLGDFDPEPFSWSFEPKLVGTHCIFVNDINETNCGRCKKDQDRDLHITGIIPLTTALLDDVDAGRLESLEPEDVAAYLKTNLHWRVTKLDDSPVDRDHVPELKISVISSPVRKATEDEDFPQWGDYTIHDDVTTGRPAGFNSGEQI